MKLKNKKTGEIVECLTKISFVEKSYNGLSAGKCRYFDSIDLLNAEWEDYKEPKKHYEILAMGAVMEREDTEDEIFRNQGQREIGNYFETREDAEKAVEKLKAWKRLKDNCNFRFNGVKRDERGRLIGVKVKFDKAQVTFDNAKKCYEILDLLFGGEE